MIHDMGHFCGYVAFSKTHPILKIDPDSNFDFSFHGGVTYQGDAWWLKDGSQAWGFDCAHAGDFMIMHALMCIDRGEAKDMQDYLKNKNKEHIRYLLDW